MSHALTALDAMARQLHAVECEALYRVPPQWRPEHHARDRRRAVLVLAGLRADGFEVTPVEEI